MNNRFYGKAGFFETKEIPEGSGVFKEVITEKGYYGEFLDKGFRLDDNQIVNHDIMLSNRVSLLANRYAFEHASYLVYVTIAGTKWAVSSINFDGKRLICSFKGVYRGGE